MVHKSLKRFMSGEMPLPDTFDAYVPSNFLDLFARANGPLYAGLTELRELEGDVAKRFETSYKHAQKLYSQTILNHCLRCFYLSLGILQGFPSNTPSIPQISRNEVVKRVYLACILHDVGLSSHENVTTHPARDMTFEFHGGIMAYEHLRTEYVPSLQLNDSEIADIAQSIMLHDTPFQIGMSSTTEMLLHVSAFVDVLGYDAVPPNTVGRALHRDTLREIEEAFPRGEVTAFVEQIEEMMKTKPNCLMNHLPNHLERLHESIGNSIHCH